MEFPLFNNLGDFGHILTWYMIFLFIYKNEHLYFLIIHFIKKNKQPYYILSNDQWEMSIYLSQIFDLLNNHDD